MAKKRKKKCVIVSCETIIFSTGKYCDACRKVIKSEIASKAAAKRHAEWKASEQKKAEKEKMHREQQKKMVLRPNLNINKDLCGMFGYGT